MTNLKKNIKVSVIVSVLNGASKLEKCLLSIINLDYPSVEIIVIDGNSSDGTQQILEKYNKKIFYWISEPDTGIYNAWNKAIKVATGDWISFIGSDDEWYSSESIRSLALLACYPNVNFVSGKVILVDKNNKPFRVVGTKFNFNKLSSEMKFAHVGSLHHISIFREHGLFCETYKIAGDYDFFIRNGKSIRAAFTPNIIVSMGSNGASNTKPLRVFYEGFVSLKNSPDFGFVVAVRFFILSTVKIIIRKSAYLISSGLRHIFS